MWNIVRMEDGKNYLADVTNCDGTKGGTISAGFPDKLFLAGVSGTVSTGYLASLTTYYGSSREITYVYDTKTGSLYNTDVLTLSLSLIHISILIREYTPCPMISRRNLPLLHGQNFSMP